jgi:hypothetical protein
MRGRAGIRVEWSNRGSWFTDRTTNVASISSANFMAGKATHAARIRARGGPGTAQKIAWNQTKATAIRGSSHHAGSTPAGSQTSTVTATQRSVRAPTP